MPSVSVQIGLLAVAKQPASADKTQLEVARDRVLAAGHRVVATQAVADTEDAIHAQLTRWIADPQIDAVVILSRADSDAIARAVTKAGATTKATSSEAARCEDTFVFVLTGTVAQAMEKKILPQFDPTTTPRNLVAEMPRLRRLETESVPVAIVGEKTQGGSGLPERLPAKPAPRAPARTAPARTPPPSPPASEPEETLQTLDPDEDLVEDVPGTPTTPPPSPRPRAGSAPPPPPSASAGTRSPTIPPVPPSAAPFAATSATRSPTTPPVPAPPSSPAPSASPAATRTPTTPPAPAPSASPAATRTPTTPPSPPAPSASPAATRTPTIPPGAPPPAPPVATSATRSPTIPPAPRASEHDLPRGNFTYATKRRGIHPALYVLGGIAVVALGFFGLIAVLGGDSTPKASEPVAATTPVEPMPAPVEPTPAPVEPAPVEPAPVDPAPSATAPVEPSAKQGRGPSTSKPGSRLTPSTQPAAGPVTTPDTGPTTKPEVTPPSPPPPAPPADGCDETRCVMSNYDRPCCARYKPAKPDFAPRIGGVPETLDKMLVRAGVETVKPRVVKCGEDTKVTGTVRVALTVAPEGNVTDASLESSPDPTLGTCVVNAMKRAKFGASVNGASFTYPFSF